MSTNPDVLGHCDIHARRNDILHRYQTIRQIYAKPDDQQMIRFTLPDTHPERAVLEGDKRLLLELANQCREDQHLLDTVHRKIMFLHNRLESALMDKSILWADESSSS